MSVNPEKLWPRLWLCCTLFFLLWSGCAYFNTFYNAQNYYNQGKKLVASDTLKMDSEFFDKTIEKSMAVVIKYPNSRYVDDALFLMAASYYYKGDYPRALEKFDLLTFNYASSKFYDDALYYKGLAYYKMDKLNKAVIAFNEAMEYRQFKKQAALMLCYTYLKENNYNDLIAVVQTLLKTRLKFKEKLEALNIMAEAQYNAPLYNDALSTYNILLDLTRVPEDQKKIKLKMIKIYFNLEKYEECHKFLAGESDPEYKLLLANLHAKLGNDAEAMGIYHDLTLTDQSAIAAMAYFELGRIFEETDSLDMAIAYYDSAWGKYTGEYGVDARKRSDILKRIKALSGQEENKDQAKFMLAEIYYVDLKDIKKALGAYAEVYETYPKSKWAAKALYAQYWITKNIVKDDSLASVLAEQLLAAYPETEYAVNVTSSFSPPPDTINDEE